jgi:prolyl oligopeptidase
VPGARRDDVIDVVHGVEIVDSYRWLENSESEETAAWTQAQNAATRAALDALPDRARLHRRSAEVLGAGASSAPHVAGHRVFSLDRWGDLDQAVLVVRSAKDAAAARTAEPRILVDPHARTGDATAALDWYHPSRDGRLVAYGISTDGNERSTLYILDVETGRDLPDRIPDTRAASVAWLPDNSGFAYTRYPAGDEYHRHVRWHRLGDDAADDAVLFDDLPDPTAWPEVSSSIDGAWLLIHVALGWTRVDLHLVERATGTRTTVIEGDESVNAFTVVDGRLVGHTTHGADRGRVVAAPLVTPQPDHWTTLVAESDEVISGLATTADSLLVLSDYRAVSRLRRYDLDGTGVVEVALPELGSLAGLSGSDDEDLAVFSFTSFTRPPSLFRWTPTAVEPWSELPGAIDPSAYSVEQVRYRSTDGAEVSMFLVRNGSTADGPDTPVILTGYGGFGLTMTPAFSPTAVAWCEDGGLYAVACLRGGAEEGEAWHRAGMREHKQQVFDDFHAAADWLVANGLTSRERLAIRGGSNGGLLVGAALTQRPDLCRAVLCAVPLLDMVRFHLFLIARLWIPEYGDPDEATDFEWLYAYSPYHHVVPGTCYPSVLFLTGEEDSRVDPSHARKMAALVQSATSCGDARPILLRVESRAGHGQGKPVTKQADELADILAFCAWQLSADGAVS